MNKPKCYHFNYVPMELTQDIDDWAHGRLLALIEREKAIGPEVEFRVRTFWWSWIGVATNAVHRYFRRRLARQLRRAGFCEQAELLCNHLTERTERREAGERWWEAMWERYRNSVAYALMTVVVIGWSAVVCIMFWIVLRFFVAPVM